MKRIIFSVLFALTGLAAVLFGQETPVEKGLAAITGEALRSQLGFLASDWMEGREAGEKGEYLAGDYIAAMLQLYGVKPGGDPSLTRSLQENSQPSLRSYFQNFTFLKSVQGDIQELRLIARDGNSVKTSDFIYNVDFIVRPYPQSIEIEAPVVFAGYGFVNNKLKINDLEKLDLKGKFVLRISGTPLFARKSLSASEIATSRTEAENILRQKGAVGIIEFNPSSLIAGGPAVKEFLNLSPSEGPVRPDRQRARYFIPGKMFAAEGIRIEISLRAANELLRGTGYILDDLLKKADENQLTEIPQLTGKTIFFKTNVITSQIAVRNIIGIVEGSNADQVIVVAAHYDHMGIGNGYIWNGADDNASGTAGVLTLAKAVMATGKKPEKSIIFALWTAEEFGLLGSRYYVRNLLYPVTNLKLNINFDMISRYISDENQKGVVMTYTSSFPGFRSLTENNLKKYNIDLLVDYQPSNDPPGGSDHRSFVEAGVPIMRFKPGHREEYHTPEDEISTVDWDIMEKIVRISFTNLWELANSSW